MSRQQDNSHLMSEAVFRDPAYGIRKEVQDALIVDMKHGFDEEKMTKVQQLSLNYATRPENYSIRVQAQSGSGKTIAFILAVLHKLDEKVTGADSLQAIICGHNRELVAQIHSEILRVSGRIVDAAGNPALRIEVLEKDREPAAGVCQSHVIIATPAMVGKYSKKQVASRFSKGREAYFGLEKIKVFVVDEADEQVVRTDSRDETNTLLQVMTRLPTTCQVLLFSATYPEESVPLCEKAFHGRVKVDVTISKDTSHLREILHLMVDASKLEMNPANVAALQAFRDARGPDGRPDPIGRNDDERKKLLVLERMLKRINMSKCIIFATQRETCFYIKDVAARMPAKIDIEVLTGAGKDRHNHHAPQAGGKEASGMTDRERDVVVNKFRTEPECKFLAATNVIARGLDVPQVSAVVNFELPEEFVSRDVRGPRLGDYKTYVHRVGRTGRIGAKGAAINIVFGAEQEAMLRKISKDAFDKDVVEEFSPNDVELISEKVREHTFGSGSSSGGGKAGDA